MGLASAISPIEAPCRWFIRIKPAQPFVPLQPLNLGALEGFPYSRASPLLCLAKSSSPLLSLRSQCRCSGLPAESGPGPPTGRAGASAATRSRARTRSGTRQLRHRCPGSAAAIGQPQQENLGGTRGRGYRRALRGSPLHRHRRGPQRRRRHGCHQCRSPCGRDLHCWSHRDSPGSGGHPRQRCDGARGCPSGPRR
jgi:hypothetical protein